MDILQRKTQLHEPVHYLGLCEEFAFSPSHLNVERQVTDVAELHNNNEHTLVNKAPFVSDDIWVREVFKQVCLSLLNLSNLLQGELLLAL